MYQLTQGNTIIRLADNAFIPPDPANTDYQAYLRWLEDGNTPEPAPPPPPPAPDYVAFWDALMTSSLYVSIREQSFTSLPINTLATELIALLGDAKAGRANETAIQQSIESVLFYGTFTDTQLNELQNALATGHLNVIYTFNS